MIVLVVVAAVAVIALLFVFQHAEESSERSEAVDRSELDARTALVSGDPAAALRVLSAALKQHPDSAVLRLMTARAYCARGRFKDALDACAKAEELDLDGDQSTESRYLSGRALAGRYLETGATDDKKRSEAELRPLFADTRFAAAAKILIGRVLTRTPAAADPAERREAIELLEAGLADSSAREWVHDFDEARAHLEGLKASGSKAGG